MMTIISKWRDLSRATQLSKTRCLKNYKKRPSGNWQFDENGTPLSYWLYWDQEGTAKCASI